MNKSWNTLSESMIIVSELKRASRYCTFLIISSFPFAGVFIFNFLSNLQPNMNVEGIFYVNKNLEGLMFDELKNSCSNTGIGGFLPGVKQIANVAALPGIVGK